MASLGDPKYGLSVVLADNQGKNNTKTINYINLAIGGASQGYGVDKTLEFAEAIASLTGGEYMSAAITSQMVINPTEGGE